jgi:DNA-binding transcriptional ArsR family regulator
MGSTLFCGMPSPTGRLRYGKEGLVGRPAIITRDAQMLPTHELLARVFRTLGDASRLRIVEALTREGEMSQSRLIAELGLAQSRASEHLACLAWCGFVETSRRGREVIYRIAGTEAMSLLDMARTFMAQNESALGSCATLDGEARQR